MTAIEGVPTSAGEAAPLGSQRPAALAGAGERSTGFKNLLDGYLEQVNDLQVQADRTVRDLATGKLDNLHQVVVAINEADLSFRLMMQVRNRLVEAYKEIIRMQV
jgi:flagellar hook-basal body complex protein FliE